MRNQYYRQAISSTFKMINTVLTECYEQILYNYTNIQNNVNLNAIKEN